MKVVEVLTELKCDFLNEDDIFYIKEGLYKRDLCQLTACEDFHVLMGTKRKSWSLCIVATRKDNKPDMTDWDNPKVGMATLEKPEIREVVA